MLELEVCAIALSHNNSKSVKLSTKASTSSKRNSRLEVEEEIDMLSSFCRHKKKVLLVHVIVQCLFRKTKGCMWNDHGRVENNNRFFYIRKLNNVHTYGAEVCTMNHSRMRFDLVADLIVKCVRDNPLTRPIYVVWDFKLGYGLRSCNPGSCIEFECGDDTKRFKRLFIAFHGRISGFDYCQPLLFLDGTFVKRRFRRNLLVATGKDGNQGFFPVCFAIVGSKNQDNWHWFLEHLCTIVSPRENITFVSDRNLGLVEVLPKVFPMTFHAYCLYYLKMNLRHHLRGIFHGLKEKLITLFGKCAYAPTEETIHQCLGELKTEEERHFPITKLIDSVRIKLTRGIAKWRELVNKWNGVICPKMESKLHDAFNTSRPWIVSSSVNDVYEVHSHPSVSVDISRQICSCGEWQLKGVPCAHAVGAIQKSGHDLSLFADQYFYVQSYREKQPGTPNEKRIRSNGEKVKQVTCGRYGKVGNHNKKSCKEDL
ncbi:uncharacterized protein LOC114260234 [Camellia sinensis]|uniref:uncharacterized protein LOC114260234 n=1 Tax=Camellia sinensis TaxID=4442 RepID=UPI0010363E2E|nr:uncharacterized protein LOC114260234 [Camellia sinensis]